MNILTQTTLLRHELAVLAARPEWPLLVRHDLLADKLPTSLFARIYRRIRNCLTTIGLLSPRVTPYPWTLGLTHAPAATDATPLLIWALGTDPALMRQACQGLSRRLQVHANLAPILVTDIADFALYSRLGWLVEYLPELSGEGPSYRERKQRYLAWRYRDAVVVPVAAGLADDAAWRDVLRILPR